MIWMERRLRLWLFGLLSFVFTGAMGQGYWFFGNKAGINFNTQPPTSIDSGQTENFDGSGVLCDGAGKLIFYSDGDKIWNRQHKLMQNGAGIGGDGSASQPCIILQKPGSNDSVFIISTFNQGGQLAYSIVDLSLDSGRGGVTATKNRQLLPNVNETTSAVRHQNGQDWWIVAHGANNDLFYTYKLTAQGLDNQPIVSRLGPVVENPIGYLKFNYQGNRAALTTFFTNKLVLLSFNNSSGQFTGVDSIFTFDVPYGVEFSRNGNYLYFTTTYYSPNQLLKMDLADGDTTVLASEAGSNYELASLEMGPDGRIYMARNENNFIACITYPDSNFTNTYIPQAILLAPGTNSRPGLPNTVRFTTVPSVASATAILDCFARTIRFDNQSTNANSYLWNFGDTASLSRNTSNEVEPAHTFSGAGQYTVTLIARNRDQSDTVLLSINIPPLLPLQVQQQYEICSGGSVTLSVSGARAYVWSADSAGLNILLSNDSAGRYAINNATNNKTVWVRGQYADGCLGPAAKIALQVNPNPSIITNPTVNGCQSASLTLSARGGTRYQWATDSLGTTILSSNDSAGRYTITNLASSRTVWVSAQNAFGCRSATTSILVRMDTIPVARVLTQARTCKLIGISLRATGGTNYSWYTDSIGGTILLANDTVGLYEVRNPTASQRIWVVPTSSVGCSGSAKPVNLIVDSLPILRGQSAAVCFASPSGLRVLGAKSYNWYTDSLASQQVLIGDTLGALNATRQLGSQIYYVIGTNTFGCKSIPFKIKISVDSGPIVAGATNYMACIGKPIVFSISGATRYRWSSDSAGNNVLLTNAFGGTYRTENALSNLVVWGRGISGRNCPGKPLKISLKVDSGATVGSIKNLSLCKGNDITLIATGGNPYRWTRDSLGTVTLLTNDQMGRYSIANVRTDQTLWVRAKNNAGCEGFPVKINLKLKPTVIPSAPALIRLCEGNAAVLEARGGYNYYWANDSAGTQILLANDTSGRYTTGPILQNRSYFVRNLDSNGCYSDAVEIKMFAIALPNVDAGPSDTTVCANEMVISKNRHTALTNFIWEPASFLSSDTAANPVFFRKWIGSEDDTVQLVYRVKNIYAQGCFSTDSIRLTVLPTLDPSCRPLQLVIPNIITPNNGDLLNQSFYIKTLKYFGNARLQVWNRLGKQIFSQYPYTNDWVPNIATGTYYFLLQIDGQKARKGWLEIVR